MEPDRRPELAVDGSSQRKRQRPQAPHHASWQTPTDPFHQVRPAAACGRDSRKPGRSGIDGLIARARAKASTKLATSDKRGHTNDFVASAAGVPLPASKRTSRWLSDNPLAAAAQGALKMSDRVSRMWEGADILHTAKIPPKEADSAVDAMQETSAPRAHEAALASRDQPSQQAVCAAFSPSLPSSASVSPDGALTAASAPAVPANSVARYEVLNRIAEGSYGTVYRARDRVEGSIVAIKQIKLDALPQAAGFPASAMREIWAMTSLSHPLLLKLRAVMSTGTPLDASSDVGASSTPGHAESTDSVYAGFRSPGQVLMVMDYCDHDVKSFQQALGREFAEAEVKCLALQLLEALACMHARHVFHRDLKPANLLCTIDCRLRVADFGLAKRFHTPPTASTSPRFVVTPTYRAIELLLGEHSYGPALDVWSAGCIIAELLCGAPLFRAASEAELAVKILSTLGLPNSTPAAGPMAATSTRIAAATGTPSTSSSGAAADSAAAADEWPGWRSLPYVSSLRGIRALAAVPAAARPARLRKLMGLPARSVTGRNCVSDEGVDLLTRMLSLNPARRISPTEAMSHTWFQSAAPPPQRRDLMPRVPSTNENASRAACEDDSVADFSTRGAAVEARRMLGLQ